MKDFIEILDYCGFDLARAHELANAEPGPDVIEEVLRDCGLEHLEPEPDGGARR